MGGACWRRCPPAGHPPTPTGSSSPSSRVLCDSSVREARPAAPARSRARLRWPACAVVPARAQIGPRPTAESCGVVRLDHVGGLSQLRRGLSGVDAEIPVSSVIAVVHKTHTGIGEVEAPVLVDGSRTRLGGRSWYPECALEVRCAVSMASPGRPVGAPANAPAELVRRGGWVCAWGEPFGVSRDVWRRGE